MLTAHRLRGAEGRGKKPCKFAEKVWNAQNAGAVGVGPSPPAHASQAWQAPHFRRVLPQAARLDIDLHIHLSTFNQKTTSCQCAFKHC